MKTPLNRFCRLVPCVSFPYFLKKNFLTLTVDPPSPFITKSNGTCPTGRGSCPLQSRHRSGPPSLKSLTAPSRLTPDVLPRIPQRRGRGRGGGGWVPAVLTTLVTARRTSYATCPPSRGGRTCEKDSGRTAQDTEDHTDDLTHPGRQVVSSVLGKDQGERGDLREYTTSGNGRCS